MTQRILRETPNGSRLVQDDIGASMERAMTDTPTLSSRLREGQGAVLDIGADNPRIQCRVCGKWKRLHGKDEDGNSVDYFHAMYEKSDGTIVEHEGHVCTVCETLAATQKE